MVWSVGFRKGMTLMRVNAYAGEVEPEHAVQAFKGLHEGGFIPCA